MRKKKCQQNLSEVSQFPFIHNVFPSKLVNTLPLLAHLPSGHYPEPSASYTKTTLACWRTVPDPAPYLSPTSFPVSSDLSYHYKGKINL